MIELSDTKDIYLLAFYPSPETNEGSRQIIESSFRALQCVYGCGIQIMTDPEEALNLRSMPYVAIEQPTKDSISLKDFVHPDKAVYIVGNSKYSHPSYWFDPVDYEVHIDVPVLEDSMYGFQAAAIVLNDRYMKNGAGI